MNLVTVKTLGSTLVLISALSGCKASQAPEASTATPTAEMATAPAAAPEAMPAAEADAEAMTIPDTADGIWLAIDKHSGELKAAIDSGALDTVHHHAFAIRDLLAALPERSPTLSAEDKAKLDSEVKFVATLADRLDETGDAGDKAGTQANYDKLSTVLTGITRTK